MRCRRAPTAAGSSRPPAQPPGSPAAHRRASSGPGARTDSTQASGATASNPAAVRPSYSARATATRPRRRGPARGAAAAARPARRPTGAGARPVSKMKVRAELTRCSITRAGPSTAPPWLPSDFDSVTVHTTSSAPASPAACDRAPAALPQHPEPVRVVDQQPGARRPADLGETGQRRGVAVHREDRVGDRDRRPVVAVERLAYRVGVPVRDHARCRARDSRQPSISEAWLSASETISAAGRAERGDGGEVRRVAGGEDECGLEAAELGEFALQLGVQRGGAGDQAGAGRAGAPAQRGVGRRPGDLGVAGQAQVVVARQVERRAVGGARAQRADQTGAAAGLGAGVDPVERARRTRPAPRASTRRGSSSWSAGQRVARHGIGGSCPKPNRRRPSSGMWRYTHLEDRCCAVPPWPRRPARARRSAPWTC